MSRRRRTTDEDVKTEPFVAPGMPRPVWKTSEVVAFAVVRYIVERGLQSGDRLPLEAEMVDQYGVSRESLREALRLLEAQGIVSIRRGPGGGPVVGRAESMNLARTMTLYFQLAGATYDELLLAWRMLEPLAAELAARNPDRALVERTLAAHVERLRRPRRARRLHGALEQPALLRRSTSPTTSVLALVVGAIGDIIRTHVLLQARSVRAARADRRRPRRDRRRRDRAVIPRPHVARCWTTSTGLDPDLPRPLGRRRRRDHRVEVTPGVPVRRRADRAAPRRDRRAGRPAFPARPSAGRCSRRARSAGTAARARRTSSTSRTPRTTAPR